MLKNSIFLPFTVYNEVVAQAINHMGYWIFEVLHTVFFEVRAVVYGKRVSKENNLFEEYEKQVF